MICVLLSLLNYYVINFICDKNFLDDLFSIKMFFYFLIVQQ